MLPTKDDKGRSSSGGRQILLQHAFQPISRRGATSLVTNIYGIKDPQKTTSKVRGYLKKISEPILSGILNFHNNKGLVCTLGSLKLWLVWTYLR